MNNCQGATTKYEKEKKYRKKGQMHCFLFFETIWKKGKKAGSKKEGEERC